MVITWPWTVCSTLVKIYLFFAVNLQPWTSPPPALQFRKDGKSMMLRKSQCFFLYCSFLLPCMALCFFFHQGIFFSFSDVWIQDFHQIRQWKVRKVTLGTVSVSALLEEKRRGSFILLQHRVSQLLFFPTEGLWKERPNLAYEMNLVAPVSPPSTAKIFVQPNQSKC